jgi:hypothetical protein
MRSSVVLSFVVIVLLFGAIAPINAHHSVASEYDANKSVTLKGVVTRVEWQNPHVFFYIDAREGVSNATNWSVEFAGPNLLYRAGWRKDSLKPGDAVTVQGIQARNRPNAVYLRMITTSDGRRFGAEKNKLVVGPTKPEAGGNR